MIRIATHADYKRISEIRMAVLENNLSPALAETVRLTADRLLGQSAFWVWEENDIIQGFSSADPKDGTIFALFVHPLWERRGIGRALLAPACELLRDRGHPTAMLTTAPNTRAEKFYRAAGWTEVGRQNDGQIIFEKKL